MATRTRFAFRSVVGAGIVAGLVFAVFEMLAATLLAGPQAAFMPLRMIGAITLGPAALDPSYSLPIAALTGTIVHIVLSVLFATLFAALVPASLPTRIVVTLAAAYGLVLWLINFYAIAPVAGWTWFPQQTNPLVQFLAHVFFFGAVLGWYLHRTWVPVVPTGTAVQHPEPRMH